MLEEEKWPFPTLFNPFRPSTCNQPKPQTTIAAQIKLIQNAIAGLLLLHTIQKIQLKSASILAIALATSLFTNILFYGKYATKARL
jgi:hypothetical protein